MSIIVRVDIPVAYIKLFAYASEWCQPCRQTVTNVKVFIWHVGRDPQFLGFGLLMATFMTLLSDNRRGVHILIEIVRITQAYIGALRKVGYRAPQPKSPIGIRSGTSDYIGPGSTPENF